jgi:hypothetical protein
VRRLLCGEPILRFVPDREQRLWRTPTHAKHRLSRDKVRLPNEMEALLENVGIKLSSFVGALKGTSLLPSACAHIMTPSCAWRRYRGWAPTRRN